MSQFVSTPVKTFQASAAIAQFLRVKLSSGKLAVSGVTDDDLGTLDVAALAADEYVGVRLVTAQGTCKMVAAGAVTKGARVYQAASGKIDDTATGKLKGIALEAATADGDVIEVLPMTQPDTPVVGLAAGYKIARGQHTTVAASDTVVTGLATVVSVVAQLDDDPVDGAMHATSSIGDQAGAPAAGSVLIKTWKSTDADATLIAATTFSKKVNWIAVGT